MAKQRRTTQRATTRKPAAAGRARSSKAEAAQVLERVKASSREAWQASMGALAKAQQDGYRNVETLLADGRKLEKRAREAGAEVLERLAEQAPVQRIERRIRSAQSLANTGAEKVQAMVEERVQDALARLGLPTRREFEAVERKLDRLIALLEARGMPRTRRARRVA